MTDRGLELRQLGALVQELVEAQRWEDAIFVEECLRAGTFDMPMPAHLVEKLRGLWKSSKASTRTWSTAATAGSDSAGTGKGTPRPATVSEPSRVH